MKHRYWCCFKCGKNKRRYKSEEGMTCNCGYEMFKTRTTTKADKIRQRAFKEQCKIRGTYDKFSERYYSIPRNAGGKKLRVSKKTKKLWKKIKQTERKPTLLRNGQKWLASLHDDIWNVPENSYAKKIEYSTGEISKSRGGWGTPKLGFVKREKYSHGTFRAGFTAGGVFIELNRIHAIGDVKATLLHEALHWIDSLSQTPSNHDHYFHKRLDRLEKMFRFKNPHHYLVLSKLKEKTK